ncbi:MAG: hypothetical protein WCT37_05125 [Patescibacteria group bacterium]
MEFEMNQGTFTLLMLAASLGTVGISFLVVGSLRAKVKLLQQGRSYRAMARGLVAIIVLVSTLVLLCFAADWPAPWKAWLVPIIFGEAVAGIILVSVAMIMDGRMRRQAQSKPCSFNGVYGKK